MPTDGDPQDALRRRIAAIQWWHRIDLNGIETPGKDSKEHLEWIAAHLPRDLTGRSVLDIGAWDGYYSFLAERRGATRVLAIDALQNLPAHGYGTPGFDLAREVLKSKVEYRVMPASELDNLTELFDVVLFLGVYYHSKDPVGVLAKIRRRLRAGGRVYFEGMTLPGSSTALRYFDPSEIEPTTFCAATVPGIEAMCRQAGFGSVKLLGTFRGMGPVGRYFWWTGSRVRFTSAIVAHRLGRRASWDRAILEVS